ncbi:hypothetical protein GGS20DRAFT_28507 [Poronia punctata]|nr:hypothetical protein GGS20DRAFT_28507 [Poronia punctata]
MGWGLPRPSLLLPRKRNTFFFAFISYSVSLLRLLAASFCRMAVAIIPTKPYLRLQVLQRSFGGHKSQGQELRDAGEEDSKYKSKPSFTLSTSSSSRVFSWPAKKGGEGKSIEGFRDYQKVCININNNTKALSGNLFQKL